MYKRAPYVLKVPRKSGSVALLNVLTGKWPQLVQSEHQAFTQGKPLEPLVEGEYLVRRSETVEFRAHQQFASHFLSHERLHLVILPTEECNFRCIYCYERFEQGKMLPSVRKGVKELVRKRAPELKWLAVSWFGGEPLLAMDVIQELATEFLNLSTAYGFRVFHHITTNGYGLTPETSAALFRLGIKHFQVTLDGPEEEHDRKRPMANGSGSFPKIWENLLALRATKQDFKVIVRMNLDVESLLPARRFLKKLAKHFSGDRRFALHLHPIGRWGGPNDEDINTIKDTGLLAGLYKEARNLGLQLALELGPMSHVCYAALPYSFVIRADGRINKCTVALEEPANQIGRLLPDGRMLVNHERLRPWIFNNALNDSVCSRCVLRPACQGASCPWERIRDGTRPCPEIKRNLRDYLEILAPAGAVDGR